MEFFKVAGERNKRRTITMLKTLDVNYTLAKTMVFFLLEILIKKDPHLNRC
jgi:hypothetical protein